MSCHFQQYLHSLRPLCIQADSSFVSFHTFWLDVAEQAAQFSRWNSLYGRFGKKTVTSF